MNKKYGFIILMDALGTKTDSIESSERYLQTVKDIESDIHSSHKAAFNPAVRNGLNIFDSLSIRFFGDTLLLAHEIKDDKLEYDYFDGLSFVISNFVCYALKLGLLFRGSIALGEYLEDGNLFLGPAVFDAAEWYEKLDMVGVIATPKTTLCLKSIFLEKKYDPWIDGSFERPPLKNGIQAELFVFNWPLTLSYGKGGGSNTENLFYQIIRKFPVPLGAETKIQNSERYFQQICKSARWKALPSTQVANPVES